MTNKDDLELIEQSKLIECKVNREVKGEEIYKRSSSHRIDLDVFVFIRGKVIGKYND